MLNAWFFMAAGLTVVHWSSIFFGWKRYQSFTKLAVMAALLAWFTQVGGWNGPLLWFGLGLVFGFAGDLLLEHPQRFFLAGLVAFLGGHVSYIIGFLMTGFYLGETGLIFGLPFLAVCIWIFRQLLRGIRRKPENAGYILPVVAYGIVLSGMVFCAGLTLADPQWPIASAFCCALGGILFLLSDSILALKKFVRPVLHGDLIVMVTYHLAQFLIAMGVLLRLA